MINVENIQAYGYETAARAMHNPLSNWERSDGGQLPFSDQYEIGDRDLGLMKRLYNAGVEQRTYARFIMVSMDITAPLYWWKEMDRYCVGKSQISTSTMHTIHRKLFELDDFSHEHLLNSAKLETVIGWLNDYRNVYIAWQDDVVHLDEYGNPVTKKDIWWQMIQLLPTSYNQRRTVLMSYEVVFKIIRERSGHKLDEWREFVNILRLLPYVDAIISGADDRERSRVK